MDVEVEGVFQEVVAEVKTLAVAQKAVLGVDRVVVRAREQAGKASYGHWN